MQLSLSTRERDAGDSGPEAPWLECSLFSPHSKGSMSESAPDWSTPGRTAWSPKQERILISERTKARLVRARAKVKRLERPWKCLTRTQLEWSGTHDHRSGVCYWFRG